jgi:hypothetical protein
MRGKLSDQDLTNYALNDGLDERERLYVESLLAVSEECREDVYAMIDMAQMLETGFECENDRAAAELTAEQRVQLLNPPRRHPAVAFLQYASAAVAMAACVAFMLVHPQYWAGGAAGRVAKVSNKVSKMMNGGGARSMADSQDDFAQLVDLHTLVDDSSAWLQQASDSIPQNSTICTPPSWPDSSDFVGPLH